MQNNNYAIFMGTGSGKGGWNDFYCCTETMEKAHHTIMVCKLHYDWIHIVNLKNGEIVYKKLRSKSCIGCMENQPNQLAHMDYGGCLYSKL